MRRIFTITERDDALDSDNPLSTGADQPNTWRTKMTRNLIQFSTASLIAILASLGVASGKQAVTMVTKIVIEQVISSVIGGAIGAVAAGGQTATIVLPPSQFGCGLGEACR